MKIDIKGAIVPNNDKWAYDWFGEDAVCPRDVAEAITKAAGEPLDVYINSGGGDIFAGSEIYAALRDYPGQVKIHVVGLAASAASVILCAGESDIAPTGMVMAHNVTGVAWGDHRTMSHESEVLKKANASISAAYQDKTGKTQAELLKVMERETWMTAQEAVEFGLVDGIAQARLVAAVGTKLIPPETIEKLKNLVKTPPDNSAVFLTQQAQAKLKLLTLIGGKEQ